MSCFLKTAKTGHGLLLACIVLAAGLCSNCNAAEPQSEPAAGRSNTESDATAIPNTKVATVLGQDIFSKDLEPPAKWLENRKKRLKLHGKTSGQVPLDTYRLKKLYEAIWKPLSKKYYIPKQEVEPTEAELQEFIVHYRQSKERQNKEKQELLKQLRAEAVELEKQLSTQDSEDQEETSQRIKKIREEIGAIEKSFEIYREIQAKNKNFEQFFAKWSVGNWKKQQWFYKRYGGRAIYQQVGPQAIDGMRDFLKEAEAKKDFTIYDKELSDKFWAPYIKEPPGCLVRDPDKVFEHPWSLMDASANHEKRPTSPAAKSRPVVRKKPVATASESGASAAAFPVEISLEDDAKAEININLGRKKTLQKTFPGTVKLDLTAVGDGKHHLYLQCPGYATKIFTVHISGGKALPKQCKTKLYRNRYVILRCAFNAHGGRTLEGDGVEEQRVAMPHWTAPKYFSRDWQILQRSQGGGDTPCDTPYLDFHRYASGFGFVKPAEGVTYEEMREAPGEGYRCESQIAKKGLVLYCRVNGNRAEGLGYGKLMVEDITETPPKDVRVIEKREY